MSQPSTTQREGDHINQPPDEDRMLDLLPEDVDQDRRVHQRGREGHGRFGVEELDLLRADHPVPLARSRRDPGVRRCGSGAAGLAEFERSDHGLRFLRYDWSAMQRRFRPPALARYMASSALRTRSSFVCAWSGNPARPMLVDMCTLISASCRNTWAPTDSCSRSATMWAVATVVSGRMTTNSSPP